MTILTIDPGKSGGIAFGSSTPTLYKMPDNATDLVALMRTLQASASSPVHAFLEQVGGYVGKNQPGSAMFTFGQNYGTVLGVLAALEIPTTLVRPQRWQSSLALGVAAQHKNWKGHLAATAKRLYPKLKVNLHTADALLIWHAAKTERIKP